MTIVCELDPAAARTLQAAAGGSAESVVSLELLRGLLDERPGVGTVVLGPSVPQEAAFQLTESLRVQRPSLGVVLVRRRIDTALLTKALRCGVREVVDERDLAALNAAVRRSQRLSAALREQTAAAGGPATGRIAARGGQVTTVFSAKGGCGKTMLATNLAVALADRGRSEVCLVDLDLAFGDVAIALQLFPQHTIADAVPFGDDLDYTAVRSLLTRHSPGLHALVAPVDPSRADAISAPLVLHIVSTLREHFDHVVIDTPPTFDDRVLAAFDVSDVVALITTLDVPALKNLKLTLETFDLLNYPGDRVRIALNRADSRVGLSVGEVEQTLRTPIDVQIPSSRDVPAAINRGVPIVVDDPRHPVSVAIRGFAAQQRRGGAGLADPPGAAFGEPPPDGADAAGALDGLGLSRLRRRMRT